MGALAPCFLGLLLLVLAAAPAVAWDDDDYEDTAPDPEAYEEELAPYGEWAEDPDYGPVWQPVVAYGWRPYVDGYWAWTSYGWTWISSEPWAWTFHYGHWAPTPALGWVWVPGTVWGPAWVDWYWGDGYVGWAPLSPFATHVSVINHFVFVREADFCGRGLSHNVVHHHLVPDRVIHHWRHRDSRPPRRHDIERVSRHPVPHLDRRPAHTVAPRRGHSARHLARPTSSPRLGQGPHGGQARLGRARPVPDTAHTRAGDRTNRIGRHSSPEHARSAPPPATTVAPTAPTWRHQPRYPAGGGARRSDRGATRHQAPHGAAPRMAREHAAPRMAREHPAPRIAPEHGRTLMRPGQGGGARGDGGLQRGATRHGDQPDGPGSPGRHHTFGQR